MNYATAHGYRYSMPDAKGLYNVYPLDPKNAISREEAISDQLKLGGAPVGRYRQDGFQDQIGKKDNSFYEIIDN